MPEVDINIVNDWGGANGAHVRLCIVRSPTVILCMINQLGVIIDGLRRTTLPIIACAKIQGKVMQLKITRQAFDDYDAKHFCNLMDTSN